MPIKRPLKDLLSVNENDLMEEDDLTDQVEPTDDTTTTHDPNLCIECGDQPRELNCLGCDESFCKVCFGYLHRTGKRRNHETESLELDTEEMTPQEAQVQVPTEDDLPTEDTDIDSVVIKVPEADAVRNAAIERFRANVKFIPMRLTSAERKYFRLLEAALNVSEYTDKVDVLAYSSKAKRIVGQLKEMCTVLTGLVVANGMDEGKELVEDKEFSKHADWFQKVFEIGRRYKIMNPEKMRGTFGKLMYMIMDSRLPEVKQFMEFDLYTPILTVQSFLSDGDALQMLDDPLILVATREIVSEGKKRNTIQLEIRQKEQAIEKLARKYKTAKLSTEGIRQALYSIGDYHAYLSANRTPVRNMIERLQNYFTRDNYEEGYNLGISVGQGGARLSHNHAKQYQYVLQSLTLWSEIMRDMYMLWKLADDDMTSDEFHYRLVDTGQGLNRIKPCPKVGRAMHNIISRAQKNTGSWVGSSVVHLGDHAVPNALFFLDKYLQVPRILNPINAVIGFLPTVARDPFANAWVESQFGSFDALEKTVLADFFKHAFDGSGADNFYDAGSCIDGRLTSTWNWANSISRKPYYKHFLVCGFSGFDGSDGF